VLRINQEYQQNETMFVPGRLKENAYRVLRLPSEATVPEIHKAAADIRRAILLDAADPTPDDIPPLGPIIRTEATIRAAVGRLGNPAQRVADRLFWFHELPSRTSAGPCEAKQTELDEIASRHDRALHELFAAFSVGLDEAGVTTWTRALRTWHGVVSNDDYWALSLAIEQGGTFEPVVLPSEVDALRDEAVAIAAEPLVIAARDAVSREDVETAGRIMRALDDLADTGHWVRNTQYDIASPIAEHVRSLCRAIREELGPKIVREQDAGEQNKAHCEMGLKRFRSEIEPALQRVLQLVPTDHELAQQSREEAALCLSGIATDYTWADDFIKSEALREEALKLARDTLGAIRIEEGLAEIREAARKQRIFGKPITSAPPLTTINGFGFTLYGHSDFDPQTQSYSTTHYFVALFLPIFPIARYRVINVGGRYRFLGKLPFRRAECWHFGISALLVIGLTVAGILSSSSSAASPSYNATPRYEQPSASPESSELADLKAQIDSGRSKLTTLQAQLQPVLDEIKELDSKREGIAAELKELSDQQKAGIEINIEDYNAKVNAHNALLRRRRALVGANKADLDSYVELEKQDSALVDKYNTLLKATR
jgi:hypothetical protein